jgi:hypothetical protein
MPDTVCLIQEGQAADRKRRALTEGLARIGQECFGDDSGTADVAFRVVKKDFGWTAGEPSRSSLVIRSVPPGLPLDEREAFMRKVCALFEDVTGCSTDEIVVTAWDGPIPL